MGTLRKMDGVDVLACHYPESVIWYDAFDGGGEGAEYLGTMIISGGLAGEHGVPRVNNPMEVSVVEVE